MHTIPAPVGTRILSRKRGEKEATITPVVAYAYIPAPDNGPHRFVVFPLAILPYGGLTRGVALQTPDGFVSDVHSGLAYSDEAEWLRHTDAPAYWEGPEIATAGDDVLDIDRPKAGDPHDAEIAEYLETYKKSDRVPLPPSNRIAIPDKPQRSRAPRVFKTNSYWQVRTKVPSEKRVWMIEGGQQVPFEDDDLFEKITGEEFREQKASGVKVEDPRDVRLKPSEPVEEAPVDDAPADIDDDDMI